MILDVPTKFHAVGRRKTSVARVYLRSGSGKWEVNGRTLGDYFPRSSLVQLIEQHRKKLRESGLLTRDARAVERKKPGQPGARKRFQFSKR